MKKSPRSANDNVADGVEKASRSNRLRLVAVPPGSVSHLSAVEKSVVGARIAAVSSGSGAGAAGNAARQAPNASARNLCGAIVRPVFSVSAPYSNTACGSSRLSEPSKATLSRPNAAERRSISPVCAISASITACTIAFPSALPSPIIRS